MISEHAIFAALKLRLDNDPTLSALLKKKPGESKVIVGTSMPRYIVPMLQLTKTSNNIENVMSWSEMTFNINAYTRAMTDDSFDSSETEAILQRCDALINNQSLSVDDHGVFSMYVEGRSSEVRDYENPKYFLQGLLCRMFAIKVQ